VNYLKPYPSIDETDARRSAILDAALRCYLTRGEAETTIEDIRVESSASVGAIYHQFENKEAIAAAVHLRGLRQYQHEILDELLRHRDAESGVRSVVEFHLDWCAANPALTNFLLRARPPAVASETAGPVEGLNREFLAALAAWWTPHAHYGVVRDLDMQLCLALWLGPSMEFCRYGLFDTGKARLRQVRREFADAAWQSLRA
jgi:AcrR family transcriptional regulator